MKNHAKPSTQRSKADVAGVVGVVMQSEHRNGMEVDQVLRLRGRDRWPEHRSRWGNAVRPPQCNEGRPAKAGYLKSQ